jgi:NAD(P)-dependent dehydrogenase (short-subunit alcohol dehydrogenase family)
VSAVKVAETAVGRFRSIDALVNHAGIFFMKRFTDYTAEDFATDGIRVNAVAPGVVPTPLHKNTPESVMNAMSPIGGASTVQEVADAVMCVTEAQSVTGEVIHIDGGAHRGKW